MQDPGTRILRGVELKNHPLGIRDARIGGCVLNWWHIVDANALVDDTVAIASHGDFVSGRFQQLRQEADLLAGSSIGLALLSVGSILSAWAAEGWRRFLTSMALAAIVLAIGSFCLARSRHGAPAAATASATNRLTCTKESLGGERRGKEHREVSSEERATVYHRVDPQAVCGCGLCRESGKQIGSMQEPSFQAWRV